MENILKKSRVSGVTDFFGRYQMVQIFLLCIPAIFSSMSSVNYVFVVGDLKYRCRIEECEVDASFSPTWWPAAVTDPCVKPVLNRTLLINDVCSNDSFTNSQKICTEWVYESRDTVIAELDLACQPIKSNMIGVVHNIAVAISMLVAGWIADWIGRKKSLILCSTCIVIGTLKTLTSSYYTYLFFEFLESILSGGISTSGLVLLIEVGGKNKRVLSGVLFAFSIYLGEVLFVVIAMFVPHWKHLILIAYSPTILFLVYFVLLNESLRWLILNGKIEEAKRNVKTIIKMNKLNMNLSDIDAMDLETIKVLCEVETIDKNEGFRESFRSCEIVKRFLVAIICKFTVCFVYYGLTVNAVTLPGNKYINFLLTTVMSFPGDLMGLFVMNRYGRKKPLICSYALCALTCLAFGYVPSHNYGLKITFYLLSKMLITMCYTGVLTYIMELFPTSVRGSMLGLCILMASPGTTLAPLTPILHAVSPMLLAVSFAASSIISSMALFFTPETSDHQLVDTIEQLKNLKPSNENEAEAFED